MKKVLKSRSFAFITGLILATTVSVGATALYSSSEIGFTPTNSEWHVNNIEDALNDLYTNAPTNNGYVEGVIQGSYDTTLTANCGFRPSKVYGVMTWGNTSSAKAWASIAYNSEVFPGKYGIGWDLNTSGGVLFDIGTGDQRFTLTDTGFTYYVHNNYETLYWIAIR